MTSDKITLFLFKMTAELQTFSFFICKFDPSSSALGAIGLFWSIIYIDVLSFFIPEPPARALSCCNVSWMVGSIFFWLYIECLGVGFGFCWAGGKVCSEDKFLSSLSWTWAQCSSWDDECEVVALARIGKDGGMFTLPAWLNGYCAPIGFGDLEVSIAILWTT